MHEIMTNSSHNAPLVKKIGTFWRDLPLTLKGMIVIALPLTLLLAALTLLYFTELKLSKLENQLNNALQNQRDIQTVHSQFLEASTGVRDYLLTGDSHFLAIFHHAEAQLPRVLTQLSQQLESQSQQDKVRKMMPLVKENLQNLKRMVDDDQKLASQYYTNQFKLQVNSLDKLRFEIEALNAEEALLVAHEQQNVSEQRQRSLNFTLLFALIGIVGSIIAMRIFSNTIVKRVHLIRDSAGRLARAEALALPSSSRDELGQLTDEIEQASQLLAQNIQRAQLAKHEAEEANKAKSRFLSRTSHELRTPLNAILGFAQLLEEDLAAGKEKDNVSTIKGAGEHLLKLINEVLDLARIESGETALTLVPTPINALIYEAIDYIAPLGRSRQITIKPVVSNNLVALADPQKLLQVILNLLSNALKYGPANATVTLSAYAANRQIIIAVLDEGKGVPDALKSRLFTPFDRLGAEQSKIEGTGLGLALSKQFMQAMGGSIDVKHDQSVFWIALKSTALQPLQHLPNFSDGATSNKPSTSQHLVLYVEDNASNRALVEAIIKRQPAFELFCASTVVEAEALLTAHNFSMAIIDLDLAGDSGESLVNTIRQSESYANMPIMILSADALPTTIARLTAKGANTYITKPIDIAKFTQAVKMLTKQTKPEDKNDRV